MRDIEEFRLPEMDAHGIAMQVLSINEPSVQKVAETADAIHQPITADTTKRRRTDTSGCDNITSLEETKSPSHTCLRQIRRMPPQSERLTCLA